MQVTFWSHKIFTVTLCAPHNNSTRTIVSFDNSLRVKIRSSSEADPIAYVRGLKTPSYVVDRFRRTLCRRACVPSCATDRTEPEGNRKVWMEEKRKGKSLYARGCWTIRFAYYLSQWRFTWSRGELSMADVHSLFRCWTYFRILLLYIKIIFYSCIYYIIL